MIVLYFLGYFDRNKQNSYAALTSINIIIYLAFNSTIHVNNEKHVGSYALVFIIISYWQEYSY